MKKFLLFLLLFISSHSVIFSFDITPLFNEYLDKVLKISKPAANHKYIFIYMHDCGGTVSTLRLASSKIIKSKKIKDVSLVFVSESSGVPDNVSKLLKLPNVYLDDIGGYNKMNLTPNRSGLVIVENKKVKDKKILTIKNYREIFKTLKTK